MYNSFLLPASIGLCWIFSSESLRVFGAGTGFFGWYNPFALLAIAVLYFYSRSLVEQASRHNKFLSPYGMICKRLGTLPAMTILLASRLSLAIVIPMAMLVTAGFTFNEIFVYWFPNFGFAFLLLGFVLFLHILGGPVPHYMQVFFAAVTIAAILILIFAGFAGTITSLEGDMPTSKISSNLSLHHTFSFLLLFLGFESLSFRAAKRGRIMTVFGGSVCILVLWGFLGLFLTPQTKLIDSTVPYLTAARYVLGPQGRFLMGVVIISACLGATNGFFIMAQNGLEALIDSHRLPVHISHRGRSVLLAALIAVSIGGLMAAGTAGSYKLEAYILGTLLLWLFYQKLELVAALTQSEKRGDKNRATYLLAALWPLATLWLLFSFSDTFTLACFIASVLLAGFLLSWLWYKQGRRSTNNSKS